MNLSLQLNRVLKRRQLTLRQAAQLSGVSYGHLGRIARGEQVTVLPGVARKLGKFLGVAWVRLV